MDLSALEDFGSLLAVWAVKLLDLSPKFEDHPDAKPIDPRSTQSGLKKKKPTAAAAAPKTEDDQDYSGSDEPKQTSKEKPSSIRRFSLLNDGPDVIYDGESQSMLYDFWSALNLKRGTLRKETNFLRRAKAFQLTMPDYGYPEGDIHGSDDVLEVDEESDEEATEQRRVEEEQQLAQQREHIRKLRIIESVNSVVESALAACESAAYLWLKGEGCAGHVLYISSQLTIAVERINAEKKANAAEIVEDEGLGTDFDGALHLKTEEMLVDPKDDLAPSTVVIGKRSRSPTAPSFPRKRSVEGYMVGEAI